VPVKKKGTTEFRSGRWWARPTLADGSRGDRVPLPSGTSEAKAREVAAHLTERAAEQGLTKETVEAKRVAMQPPAPPPKGKTVSEWGVAWLEERERRGLASVRTDRGRWEKWVEPQIGALKMATVTTEDLERLVQHLDDAVRDGKFHWKTAKNTWGLVTKAFKDACRSKALSLRVRKDNPAQDIEGPDQGAERGKQFLYPSEFNALMECAEVPARWRRLVAVQTYLYCRAGELEALHLADVDIEHRTIHIHRSVDRDHDGALKETKTNSPRRIPVEPNLLPLLTQLVAEAREEGRERLVAMPALCDLAKRLRKYLRWAGIHRAELHKTTPTSKQITWHDLRATAATWLAIRGEAPQTIMAKCGHENMETTMGYIRLAAMLHAEPKSVFPALQRTIVLPQDLPQEFKRWGSLGGKLRHSKASAGVPSGIRTRLDGVDHTENADVLRCVGAEDASRSGEISPRNVVLGAVQGQDADGVACSPLGGLHHHADPPPRVPDPHDPVGPNFEEALRLSLAADPSPSAEEQVAYLIRTSLDVLQGGRS
jgi:integrase